MDKLHECDDILKCLMLTFEHELIHGIQFCLCSEYGNINKGNFTKSHIGMYVGARLLANIHFPNVRVQTLLKKLLIYSIESKINKGFFQKTG